MNYLSIIATALLFTTTIFFALYRHYRSLYLETEKDKDYWYKLAVERGAAINSLHIEVDSHK